MAVIVAVLLGVILALLALEQRRALKDREIGRASCRERV